LSGIAFMVVTLVIIMAPMFIEVKQDYTDKWYVPVCTFFVSVFLIIAPDKLLGIGNKTANKFLGNKEN
jgi:hypothetical protein